MTDQKTIALDLDSVLADVMYTWLEEYNLIYNTSIIKQDIVEWHLHNILPLSEKCIHDLFTYVWTHRWKDIPPTSTDISIVTNLLQKAGYRISIITKRERPTMSFVSHWLDLHNIYFNDIFLFLITHQNLVFLFFFLLMILLSMPQKYSILGE